LSEEFELIQDDKLREFAVEAISKTSGDEKDANYLKRIVYYLVEFCEIADVSDAVRDVVIVAGLIHRLNLESIHQQLQPQSLRIDLYDLMPLVGRDIYNNIMYLVARQMGFKSIIPEVTPRIEDPIHVWMLPLAIQLAKKDVT
jgi:hypothetical protein